MEAGKFRICRMSQQAGNPGRASPKLVCWKSSSLASGEVSLFFLFRPSTDWLKFTHIMEGKYESYAETPSQKIHDNA